LRRHFSLSDIMSSFPTFLLLVLLTWRAQQSLCNPTITRGEALEDATDVEEGPYFEGDMILNDDQKRMVQEASIDHLDHDMVNSVGGTSEEGAVGRAGARDHTLRWPNNILSYEIASSVTGEDKQELKDTLKGLQAKLGGCITFRETNTEKRVLVKKPDEPICSSEVGFQGRSTQDLNMGEGHDMHGHYGNCWNNRGTIEHEFLHALGVWHEQSRPDRDDYVEIIEKNIRPNKKHNFRKLTTSESNNFSLPYDYGSLMHYPSRAFGIDNAITIRTLDESKQSLIGQRSGVSELDIKLVKEMYGCKSVLAEGVVTSPNFPNDYPNMWAKTESITTAWGLVLRLEFTAFNIEDEISCRYDNLTIVDGDGTILMDNECGGALPAVYMSRTNHVDLVFETDETETRSGWSVKWSAVTPDVVVSPNYPQEYSNNLDEVVKIATEVGKVLVLEFTTFDIEPMDDCIFDSLTIIDVDGTTLMEKSCGNDLPPQITSRTNQVQLEFITDSSVTGRGWVINVSSASEGEGPGR